MSFLYLDFETRSTVDLKRVGVYAYAHHPDTEVTCTGWAVDDGEVQVEIGLRVPGIIKRPDTVLVAHNAQMEREIILAKLGGFFPWERFVDTAALAARMALPRKLEAAAQALRLGEQKDMAGHRVMLKLSRPKRGWEGDEFWEEEEKPADFAALREYCRQDVVVARELHRRLLPLSEQEARLYALTGRVNDRGLRVDLAAIPRALAVLEADASAGEAEFRAITGGHGVKSYKNVARVLGLPDVRKVTVRNALRNGWVERSLHDRVPLFPQQRRALELFQRLARSSPAKLRAMLNRASRDGRVRGTLIYSGAERTQRWSSGGVQAHNFPKGLGEGTDLAFRALEAGAIEAVYDDPVGTVAEMMRGFLLGPLIVGDFAQIEARGLNWFAGQEDMLDRFRRREDPYCYMASRIFGRPITEESTDERLPPGVTPRFIGKQVVLGAGYGLGAEKFRKTMDEVFDIQLDVDFASRVIATYRQASPRVCAWWRRLEQAFSYAVHRDAARVRVDDRLHAGNVRVGGLRYAYLELPSGRRLYYAEPEMTADGVRYWGRNIYLGGKWDRVSTYGGKLAENVVQATARDLLAEAMLRLEEAGFPLVLQVHDEVVADDEGDRLLSDFQSIMMKTPSWADGLPVDVKVFRCQRYRK